MDEQTLSLLLIVGGVICVAAAIIGGDLSFHVVSIPAMSQTRQFILALFGLLVASLGAYLYTQFSKNLEQAATQDNSVEAEAPPSKE
jgi:drug/metabolite transporter (DMT)-like permease